MVVRWSERPEKAGLLVELGGDQNLRSELLPKCKRRRSKEDVEKGMAAKGAIEKCRIVRIIEGRRLEEMTQSKTSFLPWSEVPF